MTNQDALSKTLTTLNAYCSTMAQSILERLNHIDLTHYHQFLNMMYHYTLESGNRLNHAAERAQNPQIKAIFAELAHEEQYHYRLAQADLHTYHQQPSEATPKIVQDFHQFWMTIPAEKEYQYVGALYVLENVAPHIKSELMPHFARLQIGSNQAKFILTHLVADEDHGERIASLCTDVDIQAEQLILSGAAKASQFWIELHKQVL